MAERLQKLIAACGVTSRRGAETLLREGRVRLNGQTALLGQSADLSVDTVEVDGVRLCPPQGRTVLLVYKPRGFVTTLSDEKGRRTVAELLPPGSGRLYPVGRLDRFSEGLLLMTDDGALAHALTHPSHAVDKTYLLWVSGWQDGALRLLRRRIVLDGTAIRRPEVRLLWADGAAAQLEVTIHEGKNRQIRRMCEQAGLTCTRLKRIREGRLELGDLKPGGCRPLTEAELAYIRTVKGSDTD